MLKSLHMEKFSRKLSDRFIHQLRHDERFWFLQQKAREGAVFAAIRNNTVDVYHKGCRPYHIKPLSYYTDPKYLCAPSNGPAALFGTQSPGDSTSFISTYELIKYNIELLKTKEREAVSTICTNNSYLKSGIVVALDVEIGLPGVGSTLDLLLFNTQSLELQFVEAKLYKGKEFMRQDGKAKVFRQIDRYQGFLKAQSDDIIEAYRAYIAAINQLFDLTLPEPQSLVPTINLLITAFEEAEQGSKSYQKYFLQNPAHKGYKYYAAGNPCDADVAGLFNGCVL
jgi:hypothetical protein